MNFCALIPLWKALSRPENTSNPNTPPKVLVIRSDTSKNPIRKYFLFLFFPCCLANPTPWLYIGRPSGESRRSRCGFSPYQILLWRYTSPRVEIAKRSEKFYIPGKSYKRIYSFLKGNLYKNSATKAVYYLRQNF